MSTAHLPLRRLRKGFLLQDAEHNGRGGECDHAAVHDAESRSAPPEGEEKHEGHGEQHLGGPAQKKRFFESYQFLAGKLHAYGEHEKRHAHVGHGVHRFGTGDESECRRTAQHAGKQKAHDGWQAESQADKNNDDGKNKENDDLAKYHVFHGAVSSEKQRRDAVGFRKAVILSCFPATCNGEAGWSGRKGKSSVHAAEGFFLGGGRRKTRRKVVWFPAGSRSFSPGKTL